MVLATIERERQRDGHDETSICMFTQNAPRLSVIIILWNYMKIVPKPLTEATARKKNPKIYADKICVSGNIGVKTPVNLFMA